MGRERREREREKERNVFFLVFPFECVSFLFFLHFFPISISLSRGPKGLDGAGSDPGQVAERAGRGAEGARVDGGEATD